MDQLCSYRKNLHKIVINSNITYVELVEKLSIIHLILITKKYIVKYVKMMLTLLILNKLHGCLFILNT